MSKCIGCGTTLQTTDPNKPGYIPVSVEINKDAYCKRCHAIRHYNLDYSLDNLTLMTNHDLIKERHNTYFNLLQNIKNEKALVLLMIDAMDIYTSFIPKLDTLIGNNPVWILVNKSDLYPKDLKLNKLKEKIQKNALEYNLDVHNIFFISSLKEKNVDLIMDRMFTSLNKKYPNNLIYIIGATSVGKSTFVNLVLKKYAETVDLITTSMQANTTSNLIKIGVGKNRLKEECYLIDTPGYLNEESVLSCAPLETLKVLVPKNFIRVKTYQLKDQQTLFLGGLASIDIQTEKASVSCYVSDKLEIHRTKTENKEKAFNNLVFNKLVPPFNESEKNMYGDSFNYELESNEQVNIWLSGIGFLHIVGKCKINVNALKMVKVTVDYDELS